MLFFEIADEAGGDGPMTHLIDGDDLAVVVEPVGLGAKDLHLRSSAGSAGRVGVSAAGFASGSILDLVIRGWVRAPTTGPIAGCRSPRPSTRTRATRARPSLLGVENAPPPGSRFVWEAKWGESHLGTTGRADGLGLLLLRGLGSLPHPVGRERGTRAERSAMARERVFASTARVFGPSARPDTPTARVSGGARGAKVLSVG